MGYLLLKTEEKPWARMIMEFSFPEDVYSVVGEIAGILSTIKSGEFTIKWDHYGELPPDEEINEEDIIRRVEEFLDEILG